MADWWFDFHDDGYRFLYGQTLTPERTEAEVAGLVRLLKLPEGARLLDLCCGDGRHAVPLRRRGFRVCGLDGAPVMLRRARERAERVLEQAPQPVWVRADARAVPLRRCFDAAVCLFNSFSFGKEEDTRALLREARACLREGGQLITESVHRDHHAHTQEPEGERTLEDVGGVAVELSTWFDPIEGVQHAEFKWNDQKKSLTYRAYTATAIVGMLREAGFSQVNVYGGYQAEPFTFSAPVLVAHARV